MTPSTSEWSALAGSSCTGSASMSARSTTLRPGRPPSMTKIPPVSCDTHGLTDAEPGHVVADQVGRVVLVEGELRSAVDLVAQVHHLVVDGVPRRRSQEVSAGHGRVFQICKRTR